MGIISPIGDLELFNKEFSYEDESIAILDIDVRKLRSKVMFSLKVK